MGVFQEIMCSHPLFQGIFRTKGIKPGSSVLKAFSLLFGPPGKVKSRTPLSTFGQRQEFPRLQATAPSRMRNHVYLDGQREKVDLLQGLDLHVLDQAAQLGNGEPLREKKAQVTRASSPVLPKGPPHTPSSDLPLCPRPCLRELRGLCPVPDPGHDPGPERHYRSLRGSHRGLPFQGPPGLRALPQHRRHPPFAKKKQEPAGERSPGIYSRLRGPGRAPQRSAGAAPRARPMAAQARLPPPHTQSLTCFHEEESEIARDCVFIRRQGSRDLGCPAPMALRQEYIKEPVVGCAGPRPRRTLRAHACLRPRELARPI